MYKRQDVDSLSCEQIAAAYARVRARDGVFGERLELRALSEELRVPLHVFFRSGADPVTDGGDGANGAHGEEGVQLEPTEVFGAHEPGAPIELLCSLAKRHYTLLLPLAPSPPSAAGPVTVGAAVGPAMAVAAERAPGDYESLAVA